MFLCMPFVNANDIEIYYEIHGEGIPLILVSGFTAHHLEWKEYIPALSKRYKVILMDNRGAGETDAPETSYSIKMMAEDIVGLMDALSIPDAHFLGHSMGAAIVMQMCIEHHDRVRKAILCGGYAEVPSHAKLQLKTTSKLFQLDVPFELIFEGILPWLYSESFLKNPDNLKRVMHEKMHDPFPQSPAGYLGQLDALLQLDLKEDLGKIVAKTLVIAGEQDLYIPSFCTHYLMKHIPNAKIAVIKEQGHLFNLEKPQEVMDLTTKFLDHND